MAKVLVVEDDRPIATMIADELGASGHQVEIAWNGQEALMSLDSSPPDAIVLDLMMPMLNGWDFVEQYRAHTGGQTIPIVVVSAAGAVPRSMEALGVKRFLRKPFAIEVLEQCITEVTAAASRPGRPRRTPVAPALGRNGRRSGMPRYPGPPGE